MKLPYLGIIHTGYTRVYRADYTRGQSEYLKVPYLDIIYIGYIGVYQADYKGDKVNTQTYPTQGTPYSRYMWSCQVQENTVMYKGIHYSTL